MELQQSKDTCIDKLTSTKGQDLEIMANLTSSTQVNAVLEGYVSAALRSAYGVEKFQMLLRCSVSWKGRGRDDLTGIGKTPDLQGFAPKESDI